jgi:hypothetical protein
VPETVTPCSFKTSPVVEPPVQTPIESHEKPEGQLTRHIAPHWLGVPPPPHVANP